MSMSMSMSGGRLSSAAKECGVRMTASMSSASASTVPVKAMSRRRQQRRSGAELVLRQSQCMPRHSSSSGLLQLVGRHGSLKIAAVAAAKAESESEPEKEDSEEGFDAKKFRRKLSSSENYSRKARNDADVREEMVLQGVGAVSTGGLISQMRETGFRYERDDITLELADSYGFCWGVERAVQMAYEARKQFPKEKLFITNEIIHNPTVNQKLKEMDVTFIEAPSLEDEKDFSDVSNGDVVILPAFGASVHEMKLLDDRGVKIVDTTCPWVSKVWNVVDVHKKKKYTSIIHGKYAHEETIATASFAGTYLIVKNEKESQYVIDYILADEQERKTIKSEFMEKFKKAMSKGFDPDTDLDRLGVANQTTMLKGETLSIGKMFEKCMMKKFGVQDLSEHYLVFDTICDATQERQDAMFKLVEDDKEKLDSGAQNKSRLDLMIVVGGFNSSNTSHLQEIAEEKSIPSYWVDTAERMNHLDGSISHKMSWGELVETKEWLPEGKITIGITSGASTPDKVVEDVIDGIFALKAKQKEHGAVAATR